jgi:hypothetical protein
LAYLERDLRALVVFENEQQLARLFVVVGLDELLQRDEREGVVDGNAIGARPDISLPRTVVPLTGMDKPRLHERRVARY